ncbi:MAG: hypothetical protein ACFFCV_19775 [Promethearchaeota archaeon]
MPEYRKISKTQLSSILYLLTLVIYITTLFFPITIEYGNTGLGWRMLNFAGFIPGGYFGMLLLFISYYYIFNYRFSRFLIINIVGLVALCINYSIMFISVYIDNLSPDYFFKLSFNFFINFGIWIFLGLYNLVFFSIYYRQKKPFKESLLKKMILDYSSKIKQINLKDICKESHFYDLNVIRVLREMLESNQINGEYFKATKTLHFDIKENFGEIDNLLAMYKNWEKFNIKKDR